MMHASIWVGGESKEGGGGGRDNFFFGTPSLSLSLGARSTAHAPQFPGKNIFEKKSSSSQDDVPQAQAGEPRRKIG